MVGTLKGRAARGGGWVAQMSRRECRCGWVVQTARTWGSFISGTSPAHLAERRPVAHRYPRNQRQGKFWAGAGDAAKCEQCPEASADSRRHRSASCGSDCDERGGASLLGLCFGFRPLPLLGFLSGLRAARKS